MFLSALRVHAGPLITTENPTAFFTNVAARLLQADGKPALTHIQIYPTNQYTPSVHRLLQVTANLYDAATNRFVPGGTNALAWPSVFRPLFRRDADGSIFIAGYREVLNTDMAYAGSAPLMVELDTGFNVNSIPPSGTPFNPLEQYETMVSGFPLIIGAKKGWPNFNQFGMQTVMTVSRRLQFLRQLPAVPLYQTNQMYLVAISNVFGVQAWNAYSNSFPRDLQMISAVNMTAVLTNELGTLLLSNFVGRGVAALVPQSTWPGFTNISNVQGSLQLPLDPASNHFFFLPNSTYSQSQQRFLPPGPFENPSSLYVPRWGIRFHTRVRFILVDTAASRIVDYVNLDGPDTSLDLAQALTTGGTCGEPFQPDGSIGSIFCTNRGPGVAANDETVPTYGIRNQILVSLYGIGQGGLPGADWTSYQQTPPGYDINSAVNFFRTNLSFPPLPGGPPASKLYLTNEFYAPYSPTRTISFYTSWAANDPMLHYTLADLQDLISTNVEFESMRLSAIPNIVAARVSKRFAPWGGGPFAGSTPDSQKYDLTRKDPLVSCPDAWDFPTNQTLDPRWLGHVHRATPWQTLYLKPGSADPVLWKSWIGVSDDQEAQSLQPTNDWRLAALVASLLNTNDLRNLRPVNQPNPTGWLGILDGLPVWTNSTADGVLLSHALSREFWPPPYDTLTMTSNSPQATIIATALATNCASQHDHVFRHLGDIFATPELSIASPWLNEASDYQLRYGISDAAYEMIPSQLLALLRPDSIASILQTSPTLQIQFTGADGYAYAVQASSNLLDWSTISTNYPSNGVFSFVSAASPAFSPRFYRSALLP